LSANKRKTKVLYQKAMRTLTSVPLVGHMNLV